MAYEGKRMVVSDETVNTYGTRVLSRGWMNKKAFEKNPIMLYNHNEAWRGTTNEMLPIGFWKDLKIEGIDITGVPVVDDEDESTGKMIAGKMKRNVLRAASIGIRIVETSKDPKDMVAGQTRPTITKWELREISIVDIPANKNAVVFYDENGDCINLSDKAENSFLPLLNLSDNQNKISIMDNKDLQVIAGFLGLNANASLTEVQNSIMQLRNKAEQVNALNLQLKDLKEKETLRLKNHATQVLEAAIKENKIREDQRVMYQGFADKDPEGFEKLVATLKPQISLADVPKTGAGISEGKYEGKTFREWQKADSKKLIELKEKDLETFKALYKADFGKEYRG